MIKNDYIIKLYKEYIKPHIFEEILCLSIVLIYSLANVIYPSFLQLIIDKGIGEKNLENFIFYITLMVVNVIILCLFGYLKEIKFLKLGQKVILRVKKDVLNKLYYFYLKAIKKYQEGEIISIIENDIIQIEQLVTTMISDFLSYIINIVGLYYILFKMDFVISLTCILLVLIYILIQRKIGKSAQKEFINFSIKKGEMYSNIKEYISNLSNMKMLNCKNYIIDKCVDKNKEYFEYEKKVLLKNANASIIGMYFQSAALILVMCLGGYNVLNKNMTLGMLFSLTIYVQRLYAPILSLTSLYMKIQKTKASLQRVFQVLYRDEDIIEEGHIKDNNFYDDITFNNIRVNYEHNTILKNVNLKIKKNDKIALLGENGSGKTSFIRILSKLYNYDGDVFIGKNNLKNYKLNHLLDNIVCIGQNPFIINGTIKENILLGKNGVSINKMEEVLKKVCLYDDIKKFPDGIDSVIGEKGITLSGGQAQKIALARIFIRNPTIIILDEPTSALDIESEEEICRNIFNEFDNKTIITITHKNEILKYCNRRFVIKNKSIVENIIT